MAEKTDIEITIRPDGTLSIEGVGFHGPVCLKDIHDLLEGLGEVQDEIKKPEYYKPMTVVGKVGQKK